LASQSIVGYNQQQGEILVKREYTALYQPIEDGWVMATVPELPGAVTQGKDLAEARAMIKEAVELLILSYRENAAKDAPGNAIWEKLTVDVPAA
jgi:predicted RNase H-like HicB family nuclease